jgi:homoserine kinase type II
VAIKTVLGQDTLERVCSEWRLGALAAARGIPQGSVNTLYALETATGRFVLRLSEGRSEREVVFETGLLAHLESHRYPAVRLVPRADGARFSSVSGRFACVFRWAAGESHRVLTPAQLRDSGRLLARLHVLTEDFGEALPNRNGPEPVRGWIGEIRRRARADDAELQRALPVLAAEAAGLASLPPAPEGVIHADWFPDNLKYLGDRLSAVLDFEMACRGPYVLDLATALHAGCFGDDGRYDPDRTRALVEGYVSERPLTGSERHAFWPWARFSALRFTASRVLDFHLSELPPDRLTRKDWRRFRDRLATTVSLGEAGFLALCGL